MKEYKDLHSAVKDGNVDEVKRLLEDGADANRVHRFEGTYPLTMALLSDASIDIIKLLIDVGADVNATSAPNYKSTPLSIALETNNLEAVKLLIDVGADVNTHNEQDTPLLVCILRTGDLTLIDDVIGNHYDYDGVYVNEMFGEAVRAEGDDVLNILLKHKVDGYYDESDLEYYVTDDIDIVTIALSRDKLESAKTLLQKSLARRDNELKYYKDADVAIDFLDDARQILNDESASLDKEMLSKASISINQATDILLRLDD